MKLASFICVAVLSTAAAMSALQTDAAMSFKERPVMKVVRLLQDTKAELEKELEDDKAVYEVNADHKALSDATGLRMEENKEFQASETDYLEAIGAASNAITVLGKHNSLAQLKTAAHRLLDARVSQMVD